MPIRVQESIIITLLLILGFTYHYKILNEFPKNDHAWAKADRLALAKGFVRNDLNFFKPETYVLNHQFPDDWEKPNQTTITAVDFPIHDYIPAVFMKFFQSDSPTIFRVYILLWSFIGLFFVFKITQLLTHCFWKSLLATFFAATSPVFAFYQPSFLPTIPSLSCAFIGVYFYLRYLISKEFNKYIIAFVFFTLATLSRTTFAIPLLAVFITESIYYIVQRTNKKAVAPFKFKFIVFCGALIVVVSYTLYNSFLRNEYGSMFLSHFLPAKSWEELVYILKVIKQNWIFDYLTKSHYLLFILVIITAIYFLVKKKVKVSRIQLITSLFVLIALGGCGLFFLIMAKQFTNHEYYFLDTFLLPIILLFILLISFIPRFNNALNKKTTISVVVLFSAIFSFSTFKNLKNRRVIHDWDKVHKTTQNYKNANKLLEENKVPLDAKILVIDAYAPNIPLMLMERKGYSLLTTRKEVVAKALKWDFDYITIQNEFFVTDLYNDFPGIINKISKVDDNGSVSLCKINDVEKEISLKSFIGIDGMAPFFKDSINFASEYSKHWENTKSSKLLNEEVGLMGEEDEFGITFKKQNIPELKDKSASLLISFDFLVEKIDFESTLAVAIKDGEETTYKSTHLHHILSENNSWTKKDFFFQLPKLSSDNNEITIYIWNSKKKNIIYYNDIKVELF